MTDEPQSARLFRRLALSDEGAFGAIVPNENTDLADCELGANSAALCVRLCRLLIAMEAASPSYQWAVILGRCRGRQR